MSIVIDVPSAETQFDIDEFNDLYARTKPTLYIKMADIFSIHHLVASDLPSICPNQDDTLREVIRELGSVQNNEHELKHVSTSEICLTLNPKLHDKEGSWIECILCYPIMLIGMTRSRRRGQIALHGDETLHSLHHSGSIRRQFDGNYGEAYHHGR